MEQEVEGPKPDLGNVKLEPGGKKAKKIRERVERWVGEGGVSV